MSRIIEEDSAPRRSVSKLGHRKQRPPTSADVARLAGVSRATVSFVLNDAPDSRITEETRARVLAAAETLGYVPNAVASTLAAGRSQLVLIPFYHLPYSQIQSIAYDHIAERLTELGYTVLFHKDRLVHSKEAAKHWASLRPVAVIAEPHQLTDQAVEILHKAGISALVPENMIAPESDVQATLEEAGVTAAEHLIASGHQRLGVVVPRDPLLLPVGLARLEGACKIGQIHGVTVERIDLALDERDAFVLAQRWWRSSHPSGVFAYNDEYAMLLMRALQDLGMGIPGDIAVVGCDNLPLCNFLRPRLTSIWPQPEETGRVIADRIHDVIMGRNLSPASQSLQRLKLIIRESS
ncbi:LacI family transcriptional regulator [Ktedonobacter sp. SOSP1-52]|uniref:LacI family DNA-binding transcriptional regulator n=1 Tax=Ktedonobacter sp. SOSP1-52 TaxID=2778366 RepID=UPI00191643C0|nr:LacI family DNA-binding transcriptional regulator [Ktedonobacter sp. SOSP1-52]GHO64119.1 LacI family transcriptional regulator [Ktedonobacter sp. SOSP1-52]